MVCTQTPQACRYGWARQQQCRTQTARIPSLVFTKTVRRSELHVPPERESVCVCVRARVCVRVCVVCIWLFTAHLRERSTTPVTFRSTALGRSVAADRGALVQIVTSLYLQFRCQQHVATVPALYSLHYFGFAPLKTLCNMHCCDYCTPPRW